MKVLVLGAGISGRLAKLMMPEATVYEGKPKEAQFTANLGVHISISPIPGLENTRCTRYIEIDGQKPTMELIQKYQAKIGRDGALSYGDLRQFEPIQTVYRQKFPEDLDIDYGYRIGKIDICRKVLTFSQAPLFGTWPEIPYDYLINTLPLMDFLKLTNLLDHFNGSWTKFFMHRPIYMQIENCTDDEPNEIHENYLTDMENPVYRENWVGGLHNRESLFKLDNAVKIYPGKIYNHSDTSHILEDLKNYGVYCCGRYAQWNNKIHLWNTYSTLKLIREEIYGR